MDIFVITGLNVYIMDQYVMVINHAVMEMMKEVAQKSYNKQGDVIPYLTSGCMYFPI